MSEENANEGMKYPTFGGFIVEYMYRYNTSLFYAFLIQLILVLYGYYRVGNGKYWKTLFLASLAGFFGSCLESVGSVLSNYEELKTNKYVYLIYFINEINWITSEFAIPYLNMVKLEAILSKTRKKILQIFFYVMFVFFICFRIWIGYLRFHTKMLFSEEIYFAHSFAFFDIAITEFVCTVIILHKVTMDYKKMNAPAKYSIYHYSLQSSYFILLVIDICGFFLALLSNLEGYAVKGFLVPFHCLKSNFILILAFDGLIFKIGAKNVVGSSLTNTINSINNNINCKQQEGSQNIKVTTANYLSSSASTLVPTSSINNLSILNANDYSRSIDFKNVIYNNNSVNNNSSIDMGRNTNSIYNKSEMNSRSNSNLYNLYQQSKTYNQVNNNSDSEAASKQTDRSDNSDEINNYRANNSICESRSNDNLELLNKRKINCSSLLYSRTNNSINNYITKGILKKEKLDNSSIDKGRITTEITDNGYSACKKYVKIDEVDNEKFKGTPLIGVIKEVDIPDKAIQGSTSFEIPYENRQIRPYKSHARQLSYCIAQSSFAEMKVPDKIYKNNNNKRNSFSSIESSGNEYVYNSQHHI